MALSHTKFSFKLNVLQQGVLTSRAPGFPDSLRSSCGKLVKGLIVRKMKGRVIESQQYLKNAVHRDNNNKPVHERRTRFETVSLQILVFIIFLGKLLYSFIFWK